MCESNIFGTLVLTFIDVRETSEEEAGEVVVVALVSELTVVPIKLIGGMGLRILARRVPWS